jgi:hypothetical protein
LSSTLSSASFRRWGGNKLDHRVGLANRNDGGIELFDEDQMIPLQPIDIAAHLDHDLRV